MEKTGRKKAYINNVRQKLHRVWDAMIQRCTNPNALAYKYYGGRGIRVCDEWMSYQQFYLDMGDPPKGMQLDRVDNNGNYSPDNCRWVSCKENQRNKRDNHVIKYRGEEKCLEEWAECTGQKANTIHTRIRRGWPIGEALGYVRHEPKNKLSKEQKQSRQRECLNCGKVFYPRPQQIKNNQGKYCSNKCSLEHFPIVLHRKDHIKRPDLIRTQEIMIKAGILKL